MNAQIFAGCIPALMTPCTSDRTPDYDALVRTGRRLIDAGMSAVVYCGSMGDWPLLTDDQRMEGVARLVAAGVPVVVGTGSGAATQFNRVYALWLDGKGTLYSGEEFGYRILRLTLQP